MKAHYGDILALTPATPTWFDEHGVPRYCPFDPGECADIYAGEVLLLRVACQNCQREFDVCLSWSGGPAASERLSILVPRHHVHYGDPPNVACCPTGPTMNSVPLRVLEFWRQLPFDPKEPDAPMWQRVPELEVDVMPDWACEWAEENA